VRDFLSTRVADLAANGVEQIWLDPGYEFAKSAGDNVRMLLDTPALLGLGHPVVVSASHKGFLAELLGHPKLPSADVQSVSGLAEATLAFNTLAAYLGVHIVRVHDVESTAHALRVVDAVRRPG
jgi:dihydropteroate synthase